MSELKEYTHIVFGYEHYNPLGIVRTLGENGIKPVAIIVKGNKTILSASKYISKKIFVENVEDGFNELLGLKCDKKAFVYTSDDTIESYLDSRYDELNEYFFFFNAGGNGKVGYYMNKFNICELAEECGLPLATTKVVDKGVIPKNIEYPVITKAIAPTIENWKADSFICKNEADLKRAYTKIRSPKVLIQKYIFKKNELCLDGFSYNKGKDVAITISSTYDYILPDTYSPLMTVDNFYDSGILVGIKKMFATIGFEGIFSLEFLVGECGELYFLEINFRNSTWSYASTKAGAPLPVLWAKSMLGKNVCYEQIEKPFKAIVEFDDYRNRVKTKKICPVKWIFECFSCRVKYYFSLQDISPFVSYIFGSIRGKFNR